MGGEGRIPTRRISRPAEAWGARFRCEVPRACPLGIPGFYCPPNHALLPLKATQNRAADPSPNLSTALDPPTP